MMTGRRHNCGNARHLLGSVFLALGFITSSDVHAQDGTPTSGNGTTEASWSRNGPIWRVRQPQLTAVDLARLEQARGRGCGGGEIRFGDTAAMRGTDAGASWQSTTRRLASAATISDSYSDASRFLDTAISHTDPTGSQRLAVHRALLALQFGEVSQAQAMITELLDDDLPDAVASDVVFLDVVTRAEGTSAAAWRDDLLPRLEVAYRLDPASFQVRAWRVIGWLEAVPALGNRSARSDCAALATDLSNRIFDLSDAGACPVIIGNIDFAIERHFEERVAFETSTVMLDDHRMPWRQFTSGLLAEIVLSDRRSDAMQAALQVTAQQLPNTCASFLAGELEMLGDPQ